MRSASSSSSGSYVPERTRSGSYIASATIRSVERTGATSSGRSTELFRSEWLNSPSMKTSAVSPVLVDDQEGLDHRGPAALVDPPDERLGLVVERRTEPPRVARTGRDGGLDDHLAVVAGPGLAGREEGRFDDREPGLVQVCDVDLSEFQRRRSAELWSFGPAASAQATNSSRR